MDVLESVYCVRICKNLEGTPYSSPCVYGRSTILDCCPLGPKKHTLNYCCSDLIPLMFTFIIKFEMLVGS